MLLDRGFNEGFQAGLSVRPGLSFDLNPINGNSLPFHSAFVMVKQRVYCLPDCMNPAR